MNSLFASLLVASTAGAGFTFEDDGNRLRLMDAANPVFVYNYNTVAAPEGVDPKFSRACYIHPLYSPAGDVLTQDFPSDHHHHRGVFWGWPLSYIGERRMDIWTLANARPWFNRWTTREANESSATLGFVNHWRFDGEDESQVEETVQVVVHPAVNGGRALDFTLQFKNFSTETLSVRGQSGKGYGGFCFRPDATRKPLTFTTAKGQMTEDALSWPTPWADVSSTAAAGITSGAAIFQHPANPGFPHDGWMFRHYGFLGVSWPHEETVSYAPGEGFTLRYRLYLHDGPADAAKLASLFDDYVKAEAGPKP